MVNPLKSAYASAFRGTSRALDKLVAIAGRNDLHDSGDHVADADWSIGEQTPRGARLAVWLSLAALLVLIVWAAFAKLDEVTRGEGKVIPSSQNQIMQSLDGGIVSDQ